MGFFEVLEVFFGGLLGKNGFGDVFAGVDFGVIFGEYLEVF